MAIQEFQPNNTIDLSSPEGNVFNLIGLAQRLAQNFDKNPKEIVQEMVSGDYRNALFVFNREFGEFIDLKLPQGMTAKSIKDSYLKKNLNCEKMKEIYTK